MTELAKTIASYEEENEHHEAVFSMALALQDTDAQEALVDINVRKILVGHIQDADYKLRNVIRKGLKARCQLEGLL